MKSALKQSKNLLKNRTKSELLFSSYLKEAGIECKEQCPIGPYFADFYFPAHKHKIIELDGVFHAGGRKGRDAKRDKWLSLNGFQTLRIPSASVFGDKSALLETVILFLNAPGIGRLSKKKVRRSLGKINSPKWTKVEKLTQDHRPLREKKLSRPVTFKKRKLKGWEPSKPREVKVIKIEE